MGGVLTVLAHWLFAWRRGDRRTAPTPQPPPQPSMAAPAADAPAGETAPADRVVAVESDAEGSTPLQCLPCRPCAACVLKADQLAAFIASNSADDVRAALSGLDEDSTSHRRHAWCDMARDALPYCTQQVSKALTGHSFDAGQANGARSPSAANENGWNVGDAQLLRIGRAAEVLVSVLRICRRSPGAPELSALQRGLWAFSKVACAHAAARAREFGDASAIAPHPRDSQKARRSAEAAKLLLDKLLGPALLHGSVDAAVALIHCAWSTAAASNLLAPPSDQLEDPRKALLESRVTFDQLCRNYWRAFHVLSDKAGFLKVWMQYTSGRLARPVTWPSDLAWWMRVTRWYRLKYALPLEMTFLAISVANRPWAAQAPDDFRHPASTADVKAAVQETVDECAKLRSVLTLATNTDVTMSDWNADTALSDFAAKTSTTISLMLNGDTWNAAAQRVVDLLPVSTSAIVELLGAHDGQHRAVHKREGADAVNHVMVGFGKALPWLHLSARWLHLREGGDIAEAEGDAARRTRKWRDQHRFRVSPLQRCLLQLSSVTELPLELAMAHLRRGGDLMSAAAPLGKAEAALPPPVALLMGLLRRHDRPAAHHRGVVIACTLLFQEAAWLRRRAAVHATAWEAAVNAFGDPAR